MVGSGILPELLNGAGVLLAIVVGTVWSMVAGERIKEWWVNGQVFRNRSFIRSAVPDPRPTVLSRWSGYEAFVTTHGRRIFVISAVEKRPNGFDDDGRPMHDPFHIALTRVSLSFPPSFTGRYDRGFNAFDGWAIYYEKRPSSIRRLAENLDKLRSSVEDPPGR